MKLLKACWLWIWRVIWVMLIWIIRPIWLLLFILLLNFDGIKKQIQVWKESDRRMYDAWKDGKILAD